MGSFADNPELEQILLRENYVSESDLRQAKIYAASHHVAVTDYLFSRHLITKNLLGQAIAESFHTTYANLDLISPTKTQVLLIPEQLARKYHVVYFREDENEITVATDNPRQKHMLDEVQQLFPEKPVRIAYAFRNDISAYLVHYRIPLHERLSQLVSTGGRIAPEIVDDIIRDAVTMNASDIHFEPGTDAALIRFRIDGILHEAAKIPKEVYGNIVNRIKVKSQLRIDEHTRSQDGAIRFEMDGNDLDLRVSIAPTLEGEKIAIRLLASYIRDYALDDLGMSESHQQTLLHSVSKPFGMILVTGPTGSGKTTTLYAVLKILNKPEINITTIEDPVEYRIPGINQIQVNPAAEITFANGLRTITRQDPNVILVGEIRDTETAEIAVNAALTGHLLLTTFHANDAASAIPRLIETGVEPFLLASTLELVIAQRLVRKICANCRTSHTYNLSKWKLDSLVGEYFPGNTVSLYRGVGCDTCSGTGYHGRTAIFECVEISESMKELILLHPSSQQLLDVLKQKRISSLFDDGISKIKNGITTLEELVRVANPRKTG